jgi:membrane peptidoglycan carboxypeptidase
MIAAEDSGFYRHNGFDPASIQAALDQALGGGDLRGGSTITQQLCKNLFLDGRDRSLARKLRELLYALELDRHLPKERILELYINVVELGPELFGVGQAADAYFLKHPARLSPREAAFLAAILPAPRSLGERAWLGGPTPEARMSRVLDNLGLARAISPDTLERARRERLIFVPPPR